MPEGDTEAQPSEADAPNDEAGDSAGEDDDSTPAEIAEQEQAALWNEARARAWHQRTWLRAVIVRAGLTGAAAVVPYPLRITSEAP